MMRSLALLLLLLGGNSFLLTVTLKNAQLGPGQFAPEEPKGSPRAGAQQAIAGVPPKFFPIYFSRRHNSFLVETAFESGLLLFSDVLKQLRLIEVAMRDKIWIEKIRSLPT